MKNIVIVGAGGFGREVEWLIRRINQKKDTWNVVGYADDNVEIGTKIGNYKVIYNVDNLLSTKEEICVVVAIGNSVVRSNICNKLMQNKMISFPNLIDPSVLNDDFNIGFGNIICAGTVLTVNITLGNFNIINLNCTLGHDDELIDYITIYPNSNISGCVKINSLVEIGTGTQIIQGKSIANNVIIGAGAVVVRDITESGTYVGVPVQKIK